MVINFFIYIWWMICSRLCIIVGWDLEERALMLFKAYKQSVNVIALEWGVALIKSHEIAVCIAINSAA